VKILSDLGIHVGVGIAPVIPAVSDSDIALILKKAKECGAKSSWITLLRLPGNVKEVFLNRMKQVFPQRAAKIESRIRELRGGKLYDSSWGQRHTGKGDYWENLEKMFDVYCQKLGINQEDEERGQRRPFKRPSAQHELFA
jgi:DNA repair photolyase